MVGVSCGRAGVFDAGRDDVSDMSVAGASAAEDADDSELLGAAVVGYF